MQEKVEAVLVLCELVELDELAELDEDDEEDPVELDEVPVEVVEDEFTCDVLDVEPCVVLEVVKTPEK